MNGMCRALKVCMSDLMVLRSSVRFALPVFVAAAMTACVIVPMDPKTGRPYESVAQPPVVVVQQGAPSAVAPPQWQTVSARLYPTNEVARHAGALQASVIDNGAGRGSFTVSYQGALLQGEATRVDRNYPGFGQIMSQVQGGVNWAQASGQRGIANAANSNSSMRCEYLFTAAGQGTGACVVSDGARYQIHFGS
jgi:hypothetical protein